MSEEEAKEKIDFIENSSTRSIKLNLDERKEAAIKACDKMHELFSALLPLEVDSFLDIFFNSVVSLSSSYIQYFVPKNEQPEFLTYHFECIKKSLDLCEYADYREKLN